MLPMGHNPFLIAWTGVSKPKYSLHPESTLVLSTNCYIFRHAAAFIAHGLKWSRVAFLHRSSQDSTSSLFRCSGSALKPTGRWCGGGLNRGMRGRAESADPQQAKSNSRPPNSLRPAMFGLGAAT